MANIQNIFKGILPTNKKQWKVFLSCLGISTILWGFLRFSEERNDTIDLQLNFVNYPQDKILVSPIPKSISVTIQAQGFELISRSFGFRKSILNIDLSKAKVLNRNEEKHYIWLPDQHSIEIYQAIGSKLKPSETLSKTDTVRMVFSDRVKKDLISKFNYKVNYAIEHFVLKEPLLSPGIVTVTGAKSILNNIDTIYTEFSELELLDTDLNQAYKLDIPTGIDSVYNDSVVVFMQVEALKESNLMIPISILDAPDSLEFKLFPNEVKVTFICLESDLEKIENKDFIASVRFEDIKSSFKRLNVVLNDYPKFIKNIRIEPASTEYIIKSKD